MSLMGSDIDAEFLEIAVHLRAVFVKLALQIPDFVLHRLDIDFGFRLERVYVPRDGQVEAGLLDFLQRRARREALDLQPSFADAHDLGDVAVAKMVLLLARLETAAS